MADDLGEVRWWWMPILVKGRRWRRARERERILDAYREQRHIDTLTLKDHHP